MLLPAVFVSATLTLASADVSLRYHNSNSTNITAVNGAGLREMSAVCDADLFVPAQPAGYTPCSNDKYVRLDGTVGCFYFSRFKATVAYASYVCTDFLGGRLYQPVSDQEFFALSCVAKQCFEGEHYSLGIYRNDRPRDSTEQKWSYISDDTDIETVAWLPSPSDDGCDNCAKAADRWRSVSCTESNYFICQL